MRHGTWNPSPGDELKVGRHTVRLKRSLGEGGFAFIHLAEDIHTGRSLVLKRSSVQGHIGRSVYQKEAAFMRTLAHPNIVQFVTAVELPSLASGVILMEFCPGGHLLDALKGRGGRRVAEGSVLSVMNDISSAVKYMHDKGLTHRDIKLENILRSAAGSHKLCDFGSCVKGRVPLETAEQRANEEEVLEKTTTQMYRAPEMVDLYMERELTEKVDVWALGCVLYAVCYLKNPFQDAGNLGILNARLRIPSDSAYSGGLVELMRRLLTASSAYRPSVAEVESCVRALGNGQPLPPPRVPPPADTPRAAPVISSKDSSAGARSAAQVPGKKLLSEGCVREEEQSGGRPRSTDGSGRGVTAHRSSGRGPPQDGTSPRKSGEGSLKPKEPQLNPNSVAARRLASRKAEESEDTRGPLPKHSQAWPPALSAPMHEHACGRTDVYSAGSSSAPRDTTPQPRPTGSAVLQRSPDTNGRNDFASFTHFATSVPGVDGVRDAFEATFDSPAAVEAFSAAASVNQGAVAAQQTAPKGVTPPKCPSQENLELPALVDLEGIGGDHCTSVAALEQRFEQVLPSSWPGGQQSFGIRGSACGWITGPHNGSSSSGVTSRCPASVVEQRGGTEATSVPHLGAGTSLGSTTPQLTDGVRAGKAALQHAASAGEVAEGTHQPRAMTASAVHNTIRGSTGASCSAGMDHGHLAGGNRPSSSGRPATLPLQQRIAPGEAATGVMAGVGWPSVPSNANGTSDILRAVSGDALVGTQRRRVGEFLPPRRTIEPSSIKLQSQQAVPQHQQQLYPAFDAVDACRSAGDRDPSPGTLWPAGVVSPGIVSRKSSAGQSTASGGHRNDANGTPAIGNATTPEHASGLVFAESATFALPESEVLHQQHEEGRFRHLGQVQVEGVHHPAR